jgi:ATP-binding cassette subfamily B (MDR/TAP) protein 1
MWVTIGVYALVTQFLSSYFFGVYGTKLANAVKRDWFAATLNQDVTYHDKEGSGSLNANLTAETQSISEGMGWKFGMMLQSFSQVVIGFGIAFWQSWEVSLVFLALAPLLVVAGAVQSMIWLGTGSGSSDPFLDSGAISQEILMNIRTVLAFPDLIPTKKGKFEEELEKGLPVAIKRAAVSGFAMGVNLFIAQGVIYGVGMYIGLRFVDDPNIDVTFGEVMGAFFCRHDGWNGPRTGRQCGTSLCRGQFGGKQVLCGQGPSAGDA